MGENNWNQILMVLDQGDGIWKRMDRFTNTEVLSHGAGFTPRPGHQWMWLISLWAGS
jgi:hypothetical protein